MADRRAVLNTPLCLRPDGQLTAATDTDPFSRLRHTRSLRNLKRDRMSGALKQAHRWRLDLAVEIEQLSSGVRRVTHNTPDGPVDITGDSLEIQKRRFGNLEDMFAVLSLSRRGG